MLDRATLWLDRRLGLEANSAHAACLLEERWAALNEQIPWLYAMLLAALVGLAVATRPVGRISVIAPTILGIWVLARALNWLNRRHRRPAATAIPFRLRRAFLETVLFFACMLAWNVALCSELSPDRSADVSAFSCIGALAASYVLGDFPPLGRTPLVLVAFPLAVLTSRAPTAGDGAIGFGLVAVSILSWRLLAIQDQTFVRLVLSRLAVEAETRRALRAEHRAIAEQSRVATIANTDSLTGLANRRGFLEALERTPATVRRGQALILIDLDGFKPVNDTFGHAVGDFILSEVGRRLEALADADLSPARLGGDEFALVCACRDSAEAKRRAQDAVEALCRPFAAGDRTMHISACAGVSYQQGTSVDDAMRRADLALYDAKRCGRGSVNMFSLGLEQEVQRRTAIEQALREPGLAAEFTLNFQPIFDLQTGMLKSFESLARWRHSRLGWVSPSEFIPITEQISVLEAISDELLRRAAIVASQWPSAVGLSFNLSPTQLCSADTAPRLLEIVRVQGLDPARLQIEVTETALLADFDVARANLAALRAAGAKIYLDDFGAGFSSISYLREIAFDAIKIDGSLTSLATSGGDLSLLQGVLALCRAMGRECVAEHLETQAQVDVMLELGCRYGQGYVLSHPLDAEAAARLAAPQVLQLRKGRPARRNRMP